jgi:hypothetical protein
MSDDRRVVNVTEAVLDALSAGDIDAFVRCYAENAKIETGRGETLAFGHEEIRSRYETMFAEFPAIAVRKINSFAVGSYVVQEEEATGRGAVPRRHVAVYRIEAGLIVHERLLR